jgi:hypothetical protein
VQDLALQIADFHRVAVSQRQLADAGASQVQGGGRTQPTYADDEDVAAQDARLSFDSQFLQKNVAAVAEQLGVIHIGYPERRGAGWMRNKKPGLYREWIEAVKMGAWQCPVGAI